MSAGVGCHCVRCCALGCSDCCPLEGGRVLDYRPGKCTKDIFKKFDSRMCSGCGEWCCENQEEYHMEDGRCGPCHDTYQAGFKKGFDEGYDVGVENGSNGDC